MYILYTRRTVLSPLPKKSNAKNDPRTILFVGTDDKRETPYNKKSPHFVNTHKHTHIYMCVSKILMKIRYTTVASLYTHEKRSINSESNKATGENYSFQLLLSNPSDRRRTSRRIALDPGHGPKNTNYQVCGCLLDEGICRTLLHQTLL